MAVLFFALLLGWTMPSVWAALSDQSGSLVQIVQGQVLTPQGAVVHLDGLNYKDRFKELLYYTSPTDWITIRKDFRDMANLGAKTIRVWFNWIYYELTPGKLESERMIADIQKTIDYAKENNLYIIVTIFDYYTYYRGERYESWLQAHASGSFSEPVSHDFWLNDGETPARQRSLFLRLWQTISAQFKDESTIVAYNLINEPFNKYYETAPKWTQDDPETDEHYPLKSVYNSVAKAVRSNSDRHIVMVDYNWNEHFWIKPPVSPSSDSQTIYDIHMYYTARETSVQGWDTVPWDPFDAHLTWNGRDLQGRPTTYQYPDAQSGHDFSAVRSRLLLLLQAQSEGYLFFIGEFGFTENIAYNGDIASTVVELGFLGFSYFSYSPEECFSTPSVINAVMTYVR